MKVRFYFGNRYNLDPESFRWIPGLFIKDEETLREFTHDYLWPNPLIRGFCHAYNKIVSAVKFVFRIKDSIRIDYHDVWSADYTLSRIIVPTLKKLKEVKHGYSDVKIEDISEYAPKELFAEHLGLTEEQLFDYHHHYYKYSDTNMELCEKVGELMVKRYDFVLDQVIQAHEYIIQDGEGTLGYDGINNKYENRAILELDKKIEFGLTLMAKYYRSFWD